MGLLPRTSSVKPWSVSWIERQEGEEERWEGGRLEEDSDISKIKYRKHLGTAAMLSTSTTFGPPAPQSPSPLSLTLSAHHYTVPRHYYAPPALKRALPCTLSKSHLEVGPLDLDGLHGLHARLPDEERLL